MPEILVVEDADGPRNDLIDYLCLKQYGACGAANGAAARSLLAQRTFDLVILDVGLPDCHGFDLAREIRDRYGLSCGIIMLTGLGTVEDKVEGLASGADIYLVKHVSLREVEANVRSLLRRLSETVSGAPKPTLTRPTTDWRLEDTSWCLTSPHGAQVQLTATEFACIAKLMKARGSAIPRQDLIAALARPSMRYNERNLDGLISRLRRKVAQFCGMELPISVVYGVGYVFRPVAA
ncbi:response regulator [Niveispirillum sp. SYP-B3756]|uniref:response regulator transcription factor n=1 Tax=Niveispirillum sp. SYP-B3756 TaxID=2662178 RepID=UPI001292A9F7|nr:response regulator transcription factor [Niveispirillum sp. SYP-B3756]MQP64508.1 response regulator [Niveispirillum sp. SYP-B3756]